MKVTSLGHSAFLLEMETTARAEPVRLLGDPWLSDYIVGDLQGRFPRLRYDAPAFEPLDAIFVSHAHTDHLDPYTLARLWRELETRPRLVLPESLRFLDRTMREFLRGVSITYLREGETYDLSGLVLEGFFNPETAATNEDDVMVLVVRGERETFVNEADAVLPFYHPEVRVELSKKFLADDPSTVCFLTTLNEGGATMSMLAAQSHDERRQRLDACIEAVYDDVHDAYAPLDGDNDEARDFLEALDDDDDVGLLDDLGPPPEPLLDLWRDPRVVRLIGGQGICFPQEVDPAWNRVLFPIRVQDRVTIEREVAMQWGCEHRTEAFVPGVCYELAAGDIVSEQTCTWFDIRDREEEREFDIDLSLFERFPDAPLDDSQRSVAEQRQRISDCLNHRFLPHLVGARNPPIEHLLAAGGGEYRIRIRFGHSTNHEEADFVCSFARLQFTAERPSCTPNEVYWANDLIDFLDGRCDEFSTFCRRPTGATAQRLWNCLGLPYLNNDIVEKKVRLHFERATEGGDAREWVLPFYNDEPRSTAEPEQTKDS